MSKSKILHDLITTKSIIKVGGAFDALSAKLVELSGFDAVWAGSFAISATHGLPDASILTMTEFLNVTSNMNEACQIPIIADCDTGFGGPSNVSHMVKKYEKAGIAAISIEDKVFPKQNSLLETGTQKLLSEKDFVAKIISANQAKEDPNFMIIARVEALIANLGMDEAVKRAKAYEMAGADAIIIHSKKNTPDEIFEFTEKWNGAIPVVVIPTSYGTVTIDELISHKIKFVIYANHSLRASHLAISKVLQEIMQSHTLNDINVEVSSMDEIFRLQKMYDIKTQEKEIEEKLKKLGYVD